VYTQLVDAGFFDKAITLATKYGFSLGTVFEVLTKRCVLLQQHVDFPASTYGFLPFYFYFNGVSQPFIIFSLYLFSQVHFDEDWTGGGGLATSSWRMLKKYLKQYDPVHVNGYKKTVAHKILSLNNRMKLPKWLVESFKVQRHPFHPLGYPSLCSISNI
jgi:hypothetical protein